MSPSEVKPSQVAQLTAENAKLKEENSRLEQFHEWDKIAAIKLGEAKEEIEGLREKLDKLNAFCQKKVRENEKLKAENAKLKEENAPEQIFKGLIHDIIDEVVDKKYNEEEEEEDEDSCAMLMFEGKKYIVDLGDSQAASVYDAISGDVVGEWDNCAETILFY